MRGRPAGLCLRSSGIDGECGEEHVDAEHGQPASYPCP